MGKTRDLLEIPREHSCKNEHNKGQKWYRPNRSRRYLEVARIHRRTVQKKLHDPDNPDGVIIHLEPDILECEVKWALGSISMNKARGGDGISVELFQILQDDAMCAVLNMPANLENSAVATGLEKVSFHSNPKEGQCKRMLRLPHNCTHLTR